MLSTELRSGCCSLGAASARLGPALAELSGGGGGAKTSEGFKLDSAQADAERKRHQPGRKSHQTSPFGPCFIHHARTVTRAAPCCCCRFCFASSSSSPIAQTPGRPPLARSHGARAKIIDVFNKEAARAQLPEAAATRMRHCKDTTNPLRLAAGRLLGGNEHLEERSQCDNLSQRSLIWASE